MCSHKLNDLFAKLFPMQWCLNDPRCSALVSSADADMPMPEAMRLRDYSKYRPTRALTF